MKRVNTQADWIDRAKAVLPAAGFGNFDPGIIIQKGSGARVWDEDGNEYVDYLIGSGPMILGHGNPEVQEAVFEQIPHGMTFFANNALGIELAEVICDAVPCAEMLRYVSTGGEADMYAMRLARAFTGCEKIVKFEGGYHGMSAEAQMSLAPEKLVNFPTAVPDSAGIPQSVADDVLIAPFNDIDFLRSLLDEYEGQVAGIIVEPLQRIVPPENGYLEAMRAEATKRDIVLIFDEVVTGFRFSYGGAQEFYGVTPDVCTLGKVIGGGFPLAAIVGREDIMAHFDKSLVGADGWLMQLGTLSGNPVAAAAGLKTLEILRRPDQYKRFRQIGDTVMQHAKSALDSSDVDFQIVGDSTLFDVLFCEAHVRDFRGTKAANAQLNAKFNATLRTEGIFKSPGKTYPSLALTQEDLEMTEHAFRQAAKAIA